MPRASIFKTNFTAGELSPRLLARVDIAKYANGAKTLYNSYPLVHGGARRRQGTRFVAAAKEPLKQTRLIPFVFSKTQAFILEYGDAYVRFYTAGGRIEVTGTPTEVASPYQDTDLDDIHYVQRADTLFTAHPSYAIRRLVRFGNTDWRLSTVAWDVPPSEEIGERPTTGLTLGATSGSGVSATAAAAAFIDSDVGRYIESGSGRARITAYSSTTVVTVTIEETFATTGIASGDWVITESPKAAVTPSVSGPVGAAITLTAGANAWKNHANNTHIGSYVEINDGLVQITGFSTATAVTGIVRTALSSTTAAPSEAWALRQAVWNATDGYPRAVALFQQRLVAGGSDAYPNTLWGTKTGEYFNFADGVADTDGFAFELVSDQLNPIEHLASTRALLPLTAGATWSVKGGTEKPITPTNVQALEESGYGADTPRPVRVGNEVVYIEDGGKRVRAMGYRVETDAFNAPDISVLAEHILGDGIYEMAFAKKPDQVVWMVRADGKLVSLSIDRDQDAIGFGLHETDGLVESVASIPYNGEDQVWLVVERTINGQTKRYIEVMDEALETDCAVTGTVPENAVSGATWSAGVLTITRAGHGYSTDDVIRLSGFTSSNGVTIDAEYDITVTGPNTYTMPLADDPGSIGLGTDAQAVLIWSGVDHLEGETVDIVADGYVHAQKTVSSGQVTLDRAAYAVEIGLHFDSRIVTLPPELGTAEGSAQGNAMSIHEVVVRFYKSKGGTVNGQPITTRRFGSGAVLDQAVPEFTGDKPVENLGWGKAGSGDSDGSVTIEQTQPLPQQVLGVVMKLTSNGG